MKPKVVIAMSGGVDSSVAAALLKDQGFDVIGISLQLWNYSTDTDNRFGTCCSLDDLADARRVADKIKIPFYIINMDVDICYIRQVDIQVLAKNTSMTRGGCQNMMPGSSANNF